MKSSRFAISLALIGLTLSCGMFAQALMLTDYTIVGLGANSGSPIALNNSGQVITSKTGGGFLYSNGQLTPLSFIPSAINDSGQIAGSSNGTGVLYTNGQLTQLGNFGTDSTGAGSCIPVAINASGQITGRSEVYDSQHNPLGSAAFLYSNGQMTQIAQIGSSTIAINNSGQVSGTATFTDSRGNATISAFLYTNGQLNEVGYFGLTPYVPANGESDARGMNNSGVVVGDASLINGSGNNIGQTAFSYTNQYNGLTDLGSFDMRSGLTNANSVATAINDAGQIVGYSSVYDVHGYDHGVHAFIYNNGSLTDLGTLSTSNQGTGFSYATAINSSGSVLGYSNVYDANGNYLGSDSFLYSNGQLTDLNNLVSPTSGWTDLSAVGINNANQIVGSGEYNGVYQAFLLTPAGAVPESSTFALLGCLSLTGMFLLRRRCTC